MNLWNKVKKLEGKELQTLDQKKPFVVSQVFHDRVIIETSRAKERSIRWIEIDNSWNHLRDYGKLTRKEIMRSYSSYNPAYVAAILANIVEVSYSIRPITLRLI